MKSEIAQLIENKGRELASKAKFKRNIAACVGGGLAGIFTMVALVAFHAATTDVLVVVMCTVITLLMIPYALTYGGAFRLRALIKANRLVEARMLANRLMSLSLVFFPYSALYYVSTLQLDLMLRQAAYHEVDALSRLLRTAIASYPYLYFAKKRLIPLFDNFQGMAYLGLSEYELARKKFSECLSTTSKMNKAVFLNNIGVCDLQLERYEDAYKEFSEAVAVTPAILRAKFLLPRLYPNLARVCIRLSKLDEADNLLKQSADYFDKNAEDNMLRGGFYKSLGLLKAAEGHFDEAELHLRSAIELQHQIDDLHPNLQDTRLELALVLDKLGRDADAAALRKLILENELKLQLRLEDSSDALASALLSGSHPILMLAK